MRPRMVIEGFRGSLMPGCMKESTAMDSSEPLLMRTRSRRDSGGQMPVGAILWGTVKPELHRKLLLESRKVIPILRAALVNSAGRENSTFSIFPPVAATSG